MDAALAGEGITRRLWQTLSTVARHQPVTLDRANQAMALFLPGDHPDCRPNPARLASEHLANAERPGQPAKGRPGRWTSW